MTRVFASLALCLTAGFLLADISPAAQQGPAANVAECVAVHGALLARQGDKWYAVKKGDTISAGALLVGVPKAELRSTNGAVGLKLTADIGKRGPYPVLEAAVELRANPKTDLDVRFERGIIVLSNLKKEGPATVTFQVREKTWNVVLKSPETALGLEIYSRHPPGLPLIIEGKTQDPHTSLVMFVLKGEVTLTSGKSTHALKTPPGPAKAEWDNYADQLQVEQLEELPKNIRPLDADEKQLFDEICQHAEQFGKMDVKKVLGDFLHSENKIERLLGVTVAGAVDDLPRVLQALKNPKHADVRDQAILVLRHWLGRQTGQVKILFKELTVGQKYTLPQAKTIVQLLFGFPDEDRAKPATYDLLIVYLDHSQLAIRELAHWHLVRLVPEGKDITYDAAATAADRQKAVAQWRQLIPAGKLPQPVKSAQK